MILFWVDEGFLIYQQMNRFSDTNLSVCMNTQILVSIKDRDTEYVLKRYENYT